MIIPDLDPQVRNALCGLHAGEDGAVHVSVATPEGGRRELVAHYVPFAWFREPAVPVSIEGLVIEPLRGPGPFDRLAHAKSESMLESLEEAVGKGAYDEIKSCESQFLLQHRLRLYAGLKFGELRRCQLDIETSSADGSFSDASKPEDRVIAIGLRQGGKNQLLVLETHDDAGEKALLDRFGKLLLELDPDVVEGHNIHRFDLDFLRLRCKRFKLACLWGRFGQKASFRNTRLKVAERWVDFPRCDMAGRAVVDTYLLVLLYDISSRELNSYGLKEVALHLGVTEEEGAERTYIEGSKIQDAWREDRARFCAYLEDDLRETQGVADILLPTYFEQTRSFPVVLQEATLRGTTAKIDLLFLEEYYHARHACPVPPEVTPFEGGYTRSFREGVFKNVLHFDVASLYPSLLLTIGRNPANDPLGVFIPLLRSLREYRLRYKQVARSSADPEERAEAQARQASFKILINSFYGYLGFSGARFGDGVLAAEVTRRGRELLQSLIDAFDARGCTLLEADTDGIYLASEKYFGQPEALLELVRPVLPDGIELEHDGRYAAMFCYKSKNYALYDGRRLILRGSALRSRGMEPYLKQLSDASIRFLLEMPGAPDPRKLFEELKLKLSERSLPVEQVAKSEVLGMTPEAYESFVAGGGKPRRAASEVSLLMNPRPRMGDRVAYFITAKAKGRTSDWQRARPVAEHDAVMNPYDSGYYLEKLDDWQDKYGAFLGLNKTGNQGELFG